MTHDARERGARSERPGGPRSPVPTASPGRAAEPRRSSWTRFGTVIALAWLIFLVYPLIALLGSSATVAWLVVGWSAFALFVALYVAGFVRGFRRRRGLLQPPERRQWVVFAGLVVCAVASVPAIGGSSLSFLPFLMSFAAYALTRPAHWVTFAASLVVASLWVFVVPGGHEYLSVLAIVALLGVLNTVSTWLVLRSVEAERLERELATSAGREAVARDVHDLIGHSLTVVRLKTQLALRLIESDPERAKLELAEIDALTATALAGVRSTVAGIRAASLDEQLVASGEALASAGVALRIDGTANAVPPSQGPTASWILREATTNVLRHAAARDVVVSLAPGMLAVQDDGQGVRGPEGSGIRGMRERARSAGAQLRIEDVDGGGTRVMVIW